MAIHLHLFRLLNAAAVRYIERMQINNTILYILLFFVLVYAVPKLNTKDRLIKGCILIPYFLSLIVYWSVALYYSDDAEKRFIFNHLGGSFIVAYYGLGGWFLTIPTALVCGIYRLFPKLLGLSS
jgi:hypothetical protein